MEMSRWNWLSPKQSPNTVWRRHIKSFNQKSIHQIGYLAGPMNCLCIYTWILSCDDTFRTSKGFFDAVANAHFQCCKLKQFSIKINAQHPFFYPFTHRHRHTYSSIHIKCTKNCCTHRRKFKQMMIHFSFTFRHWNWILICWKIISNQYANNIHGNFVGGPRRQTVVVIFRDILRCRFIAKISNSIHQKELWCFNCDFKWVPWMFSSFSCHSFCEEIMNNDSFKYEVKITDDWWFKLNIIYSIESFRSWFEYFKFSQFLAPIAFNCPFLI